MSSFSQRRVAAAEKVPFDPADDLHLTFDAVAVARRRAIRAEDLAYDHVMGVLHEEG